MTISLNRRGSIAAVVALVVALAGILTASALRGAAAQEPATVVAVFSNLEVTASNGNFSFGPGSGFADGTLGIMCTGAAPRSGGVIPAQVVTQLGDDATRLRILHASGTPINSTVLINCAIEFEVEAEAEITRKFDAFRA